MELDYDARTLTVTINWDGLPVSSVVLSVVIAVQRGASFVAVHQFPEQTVDLTKIKGPLVVSLEAASWPTEDFIAGAWLTADLPPSGARKQIAGAQHAYRQLRDGGVVSTHALEGLDEAELNHDLAAGRINQAAYRRRWLQLHRVGAQGQLRN
ncbi:hypothetical protein ACFQ9X_12580 [Catenulispora yoronensis]